MTHKPLTIIMKELVFDALTWDIYVYINSDQTRMANKSRSKLQERFTVCHGHKHLRFSALTWATLTITASLVCVRNGNKVNLDFWRFYECRTNKSQIRAGSLLKLHTSELHMSIFENIHQNCCKAFKQDIKEIVEFKKL